MPGIDLHCWNMWVDEKPRRDKSKKRWNFRIWYDFCPEEGVQMAERVFFWDDERAFCGVVLFLPGSVPHFSRIKELIEKLVRDPKLRKQHRRELRFPLERHYSQYGAFPEEQ